MRAMREQIQSNGRGGGAQSKGNSRHFGDHVNRLSVAIFQSLSIRFPDAHAELKEVLSDSFCQAQKALSNRGRHSR